MSQPITNQNEALKFAMKLIALRRRSEQEIRKRLQGKGCPPELIETTVAELYRFKYLDDGSFAESYIHDRLLFRPAGRRVIEHELRAQGIDSATIRAKLEEMLDEETELELAQKLLDKKLRTVRSADKKKLHLKLMAYLHSRGFGSQIISQALENRIKSDEDINLEEP